MTEKPLTIPKFARKILGLTPRRVNQLVAQGKFPLTPAPVPGLIKRYYKKDVLRLAKERKEKKNRPRVTRGERISRFRHTVICTLLENLKNQTKVSASDKTMALQYLRCVFEIWQRREERKEMRRWSRLSLRERRRVRELGIDPPIVRYPPLLESVHMLYGKLATHGYIDVDNEIRLKMNELGTDIESAIEQLPVYSEATPPQTEQSSLNASA